MRNDQTFSRLAMLGLPPSSSKEILRTVQKWLKASGPEWTVRRLQQIKLMYINFLARKSYQPTQWIKASSDGIPKGVFKALFLCKPSRRVFYTLLSYTSLISKEVTESQKLKFFESVFSEPHPLPHIPCLREVASEIDRLIPQRKTCTYKDYIFSSTRFAPNVHSRSVPEDISILWEDIKSSVVWDFLDDSTTGPLLQDALGDLYLRVTQSSHEEFNPFVGKISVIQEPGFKARWIANPKRIFQIALLPLGNQLFSTLKALSWDCTHDQASGIEWLRDKLIKQITVHSVDLSDATNNFPLSLQSRFLRFLSKIDEADIRLFEQVSKGSWYIAPHLRPKSIPHLDTLIRAMEQDGVRWKRGQPLGLYPSFPAFALVHGALVRSIEKSIGVADTFRILGDDIVIANPEVYTEYRKYLSLLHVPVSEHKTIVSDLVGEFAGTLVFKDKIFESHKWRSITKENCISVLRSLPRKLDLNNRMEYITYMIRHLPVPIGDGINPEGLSVRDRAAISLPILMDIGPDMKTVERHTHDVHFRNSPGYQKLWKEDTPCSLTTILDLAQASFQDEDFRAQRKFCGRSLYSRLSQIFNFNLEVIPPEFEQDYTFNEIEKLMSYQTLRSSQSVQRKRSFVDHLLRKVVKNQQKLVKFSKATIRSHIERAMYLLEVDSLVDLYKVPSTSIDRMKGVQPISESDFD